MYTGKNNRSAHTVTIRKCYNSIVMKKPELNRVETLFENRYVNVYDLSYKDGQHYYDASRRKKEDLVAVQERPDLPDAVSAFVILKCKDNEERLLLFHEYRYPTGQYVLSIPSGLIDPDDKKTDDPVRSAVIRELKEETGLIINEGDTLKEVNHFVFCTPGLSDESTALVAAHIDLDEQQHLTQNGAEGTEIFDGFRLVTRKEAQQLLQKGTDDSGIPYPLVTWAAMMYFLHDTESDLLR